MVVESLLTLPTLSKECLPIYASYRLCYNVVIKGYKMLNMYKNKLASSVDAIAISKI